jgi:hypothetical protein
VTLAIAIGLATAPLIIMSYHYLAFRYRAEFVPLVMLCALYGLHVMTRLYGSATRPIQNLILAACVLLSAFQVLHATEAWRAHGCTPFGSYAAARAESEQCLSVGE